MRLVRFMDPSSTIHFGEDRGDGTATLLAGDPYAGLTPTGRTAAIARRLAPIEPANIFCIGLNYAAHAKEGGQEPPDKPVIFMKPTSAVNHPDAPIVIPGVCDNEVDYECELAVVIGKQARNVTEDAALDYVLGYTAANDVSARKWQRHGGGGQWIRGKGFDTFCPLGPVLVTADEITDPQTLSISTTLNGQTMQDSHTSDMIFSVRFLVSYLSQGTTLGPGTVILTGTPQGVGFARKPPVYLKAGDKVTVTVEGIGELTNPVESA